MKVANVQRASLNFSVFASRTIMITSAPARDHTTDWGTSMKEKNVESKGSL